MQLIEIVQLVLVSFAALIVVIFFVSYISYKTKNKNKNIIAQEFIKKTETIEETPNYILNDKNINTSANPRITNPKFLVFNPNASSEHTAKTSITKKHFPRTLSIKY